MLQLSKQHGEGRASRRGLWREPVTGRGAVAEPVAGHGLRFLPVVITSRFQTVVFLQCFSVRPGNRRVQLKSEEGAE